MADDDARRWLSCFGWGCLAVVVVSALAIGGCVAFVYRGSAGATTVTDAYLAAVDEGRYQDAYAMLGPSFADRQELSDFVAFEQNARSHLGACSEWARRGTGFNRHEGRSEASLVYRGTCGVGSVEAVFLVEQVAGRWLIQDIRYRRPGSMEMPVCSGCGAATHSGARFCSSCGAALDGGSDTVEEPASSPGGVE